MGEDAWFEYQKIRKRTKVSKFKKQNPEKVANCRRKRKRILVEYKGGKCERCGFKTDIMGVYDFHHKDPTQKDFGISSKGRTRSLEKCKIEVDKCELLCRNCHAIVHHEIEQKKITERL